MERDALTASAPTDKPLTELFEEVCPIYLMAGMTLEQFWDGDPFIATYYRRKLELEDFRNTELAWLNGYYDFVAVSTALSNAFRGKGKRAIDYPKAPERKATTKLEKETKRRKAYEASVAFMDAMTAKKRKGKKDNGRGSGNGS